MNYLSTWNGLHFFRELFIHLGWVYTSSLFLHLGGVYNPSLDCFSTCEVGAIPPLITYPLGRGVQSLRELFLPIIYPYWRGVHFLHELFLHMGGVYTSSVNYLSTWEGCALPP